MKNTVKVVFGVLLVGLINGTSAAAEIEIVDGDLIVDLGDAISNTSKRFLEVKPGRDDAIVYLYLDEYEFSEYVNDNPGYDYPGDWTNSGVRGIPYRDTETVTLTGFDRANGDIVIRSNKGRDAIYLQGLVVDGLDIRTGDGQDFIYLNQIATTGTFNVDTGRAKDGLYVRSHAAYSDVLIRTRAGADYVRVISSYFTDAFEVTTGGGADTLEVIGGETSSQSDFIPVFNGGGSGKDTYSVSESSFLTESPVILNFEIVN